MASLAEIRAKLLEKQNKGNNNKERSSSGGDNASFPFWNTPVGQSASIRFLPDGDPDNTFFWVPRTVIKLPFEGVVGGEYPTNKPVTVNVPCMEMFGESCPITNAIRPWWKGSDEDKQRARLYYRKKSFLFQGFVVASPFEESNVPENPIRRFVINQTIYDLIEKSVMDPDMDDNPTDYVGGREFKIAKTQKGEWANYSTSSWSMRPRSLSEAEMAAIEKFGLFDLKEYLGRRPDADELDAIKTMFECSVAGEPYDMEAFGKYFRPWGARGGDDDATSATPRAAAPAAARPAAREEAAPAPVRETAAPAAEAPAKSSNPSDILERIKLRTQK